VVGIDLVGTSDPVGGVWRMDVTRIAGRIVTRPSAARRWRAQLASAAFPGSGSAPVWSDDATRIDWDAVRQSIVIATLARSRAPEDLSNAAAGVRAFMPPDRVRGMSSLALLEHLRVANRLGATAARSSNTLTTTAARNVALRAFPRIRSSRVRGWSQVDGAWSPLRVHRALVQQSRTLLRGVPNAATDSAVTALARALVVAPQLDFGTLPVAAFYPWPRDAAYDTQTVTIDVDKPVLLRMLVYAPDGRVVRTVETHVEPGVNSITWDGAATDGAVLEAGDYRYNLDATDRAGNRVRVPGLEQFRIARDTTAPAVTSATVRHVGAESVRRLVAGWDVTESHSPQVRTWLLLQQGSARRSMRLHESLQRATVRRTSDLPAGTWRVSFVFVDGSGNRTSQGAGSIVVR